MRVELKSIDGSQVEIQSCKHYGLALKADEKNLITISVEGEVLVNGESVEPELIGLALIQWAQKYSKVIPNDEAIQ